MSPGIINDHHSTSKSWSNTSPNNDGGGGGRGGSSGKKNRHTPSSSWWRHQRRTATRQQLRWRPRQRQRAVRRWGSGGDRIDSRCGVWRSSSDVIDDPCSSGKSWSNTSPNNDSGGSGRGGGGGEKNHHTPFSSPQWTAILPDCTDSHGGVLYVVHCRCIGVGGGSRAHPSDDQKDYDESDGRGGTHHHHGNCDDAVGYRRCNIGRDRDRGYGASLGGQITLKRDILRVFRCPIYKYLR